MSKFFSFLDKIWRLPLLKHQNLVLYYNLPQIMFRDYILCIQELQI